jgi:hypothetical protein
MSEKTFIQCKVMREATLKMVKLIIDQLWRFHKAAIDPARLEPMTTKGHPRSAMLVLLQIVVTHPMNWFGGVRNVNNPPSHTNPPKKRS